VAEDGHAPERARPRAQHRNPTHRVTVPGPNALIFLQFKASHEPSFVVPVSACSTIAWFKAPLLCFHLKHSYFLWLEQDDPIRKVFGFSVT
jgi:hypothetical protein